jgi:hypothetical protein
MLMQTACKVHMKTEIAIKLDKPLFPEEMGSQIQRLLKIAI